VSSSGIDHIHLIPTGFAEIPEMDTGCTLGTKPFGDLGTNQTVFDIGSAPLPGTVEPETWGHTPATDDADVHWTGQAQSCKAPTKTGCRTYVKVTYSQDLPGTTVSDFDAKTGKVGGQLNIPVTAVECKYYDAGQDCSSYSESQKKPCPSPVRRLLV